VIGRQQIQKSDGNDGQQLQSLLDATDMTHLAPNSSNWPGEHKRMNGSWSSS